MTPCALHRTLHAEVQAWLDVGHFMQRAVALTARQHNVSAREVITAYFIVRNDEGTNRDRDETLDKLNTAICQHTNVVNLAEARRRRARRREKVLQ